MGAGLLAKTSALPMNNLTHRLTQVPDILERLAQVDARHPDLRQRAFACTGRSARRTDTCKYLNRIWRITL
ncbi:hypothetical protein EMIT0P218_20196 [Pseudomonas sp. IT-P218]